MLNLWQKNQVFPPEVIQPIFDLADPDSVTSRQIEQQILAKEAQAATPAAPAPTGSGGAAAASDGGSAQVGGAVSGVRWVTDPGRGHSYVNCRLTL